ncbi:hypothetical protein BO85DRAFT_100156 [Aspergillus piperis CBS 112811]|uniref:Uncharacterized protein n=1 Tax=Aspergillus piperis CBS 112811 TaxID=1448313 RepID=A0A8G1VIP5_9EURO|nr:hypothetical protein BO85DRAFT_100156 [Aspergillus piperis CBS 112811]RAH54769.1 hypothetical protein BO85DRAFT_100156 [Aspergillus piperis CBS 112811]
MNYNTTLMPPRIDVGITRPMRPRERATKEKGGLIPLLICVSILVIISFVYLHIFPLFWRKKPWSAIWLPGYWMASIWDLYD